MRKRANGIVHSPRRGLWTAVSFFALGALLAVPSYLRFLSRLHARPALAVVAPSLPSGGTGFVYVSVTGVPAAPGSPVAAELRRGDASCRLVERLSADGTAILPLPLAAVPPGPATLAVGAGSLRFERQVEIEPAERVRLWAAVREAPEGSTLEALAGVRSAVTAAGIAGATVTFRVTGPGGHTIGCESIAADEHGVARFSLALGRGAPHGAYELAARTAGDALAVEVFLSARANERGDAPRVGIRPEGGALVAGLENAVAIEPDENSAFPLVVDVGNAREAFRLAEGERTIRVIPPDGCSALPVTVRGTDRRGRPFARERSLTVRDRTALLCRPRTRLVDAGRAVDVEIFSGDARRREYVVELLSGETVLSQTTGTIEKGRGRRAVAVPEGARGDLFLRAWPREARAEELFTCSPVTVRADRGDLLSVRVEDDRTVALHNPSETDRLDCHILAGDGPPAFGSTVPDSLLATPFNVNVVVGDPALAAAPQCLRFWTGALLFLASLVLLRGFAALLAHLGRGGLFCFFAVTLVLYAVTALNYRLFGTAVIAVGLFWTHQSYRTVFRLLPATGRLGFRWAVPALCLAPYLHIAGAPPAQLPQPAPCEAGEARAGGARRAPAPGAPPVRLAPGTAHAFAPAGGEDTILVYAASASGEEEIRTVSLPPGPRLDVSLDIPSSLTAGDSIRIPLRASNVGASPWRGWISLEGRDALFCSSQELPAVATIAPGDRRLCEVMLSAASAGRGSVLVSWTGAGGGQRLFAADVLPAGELRSEVWNGLSAGEDAPSIFRAYLPADALYRTSRLSARLFPGPLSQLLHIAEAARTMPWSHAERAVARAHAACLFLDCLARTGRQSEREPLARSMLSEALLGLMGYQEADGAFGGPSRDDRTTFTAQVALLLRDLRNVWPLSNGRALARATAFLKTQVRADGTFRTGPLRRPLSDFDVWATCLVACALEGDSPPSTRRFLAERFAGEGDAALAAAMLAAALECGAFAPDRAAAAVKDIESRTVGEGVRGDDALAWWSYGLAASAARPESARRALARLSLRRGPGGVLPTVLENQLIARSLVLCARRGPRLTTNVFRFIVNDHPCETKGLDRSVPDVACSLDLTDALRMEENFIRVESSGSALTPYQLLFSYAVPWEDAPLEGDAGLDVSMRMVDPDISLGETADLAIGLANRGEGEFRNVRVLLRLPALAALGRLPPSLALLGGECGAGEVLLLGAPPLGPGRTAEFHVELTPVAAGRAHVQPAVAFLGAAPGERRRSAHAVLEVR